MVRQLLPAICMLLAALARTALTAQSVIRLFDTIAPWARNTDTPLPFGPSPPSPTATLAMRLPVTIVPSSPSDQRSTRMPPLPQSSIVLPVSDSPVDSTARMPMSATLRMVVPATLPPERSSATPERELPSIVQFSMVTSRDSERCRMPGTCSASGSPAPSMTRPESATCSQCSPASMNSPPLNTSRVAPATPPSRTRAGSVSCDTR